MKMLIAIGGGSFQNGDTMAIDQFAIKQTGKLHPRILFFPTASHDDQGYAKRFKQYYRSLGCEVDALRLYHTLLTSQQIGKLLYNYDMLYIGGGCTSDLLAKFHELNLEEGLRRVYEAGVIICGYSAGANLLFTKGYSDICGDGSKYILLDGLDLIKGAFCPHAQKEERKSFMEDVHRTDLEGFACEDGNAYIVKDGKGFFLHT